MYGFILLNLALSYLTGSEHWLVVYLVTDVVLIVGLVGMACAALMAWLEVLPCMIRYDLFACGSLLVWLPYWYPDFRDGSPVFVYFPLFFALVTALISLSFIISRDRIDQATVELLQWLSDSGRFNPLLIAVFVLAGLYFKQHFLLYPVAMVLLIMRYALACSLEEKQN